MSFQHCVLSSLSSSDILYYFLHACVLSWSARQMCRPHPQNLPITGFSRMFYNEIMHSYPVYLLKRILATYFRYRRTSFFCFTAGFCSRYRKQLHFRNLLCTKFCHTGSLLSLPLLFLLQLLLLLPLLFQSRRPQRLLILIEHDLHHILHAAVQNSA